jgi:hypothetical protein
MAKLCKSCGGPLCPICGGCIQEGECGCHSHTAEVERLRAEIERLESIIGKAMTVIDAAWGGPCGEALADAQAILSRA